MLRDEAAGLGWVFCAEQDGYARAEKFTVSGELINCAGVNPDEVLAQIDAWENYPVQVADTRGAVDVVAAPEQAPAEEAPPPDVEA